MLQHAKVAILHAVASFGGERFLIFLIVSFSEFWPRYGVINLSHRIKIKRTTRET